MSEKEKNTKKLLTILGDIFEARRHKKYGLSSAEVADLKEKINKNKK